MKPSAIQIILGPPLPDGTFNNINLETARAAENSHFNNSGTIEQARDRNIGSFSCEFALSRLILSEDIKDRIRRLVYYDYPVLLTGPSGVGKTTLARCLHGRRKGKFVDVNTTALPSELIESELFGHERGAFTGAHLYRCGKFNLAEDGTVFLDEIGDMTSAMQCKLLKVIEEKKWYSLGSDTEKSGNFRVICATNKDPKVHLRNDLYHRLAAFIIDIPPITEQDIFTYLTRKNWDEATANTFISKLDKQDILNGGWRYIQNTIAQHTVWS